MVEAVEQEEPEEPEQPEEGAVVELGDQEEEQQGSVEVAEEKANFSRAPKVTPDHLGEQDGAGVGLVPRQRFCMEITEPGHQQWRSHLVWSRVDRLLLCKLALSMAQV